MIASILPASIVYAKSIPEQKELLKPDIYIQSNTENECNDFSFDGTATYDRDQALSYHWDFGDGQTSDQPALSHIYQKSGKYVVKLTVKDTADKESAPAQSSQILRVIVPPRASFDLPKSICANQELILEAKYTYSEDNKDLNFAWDFDDGSRASGQTVKKSYKLGGEYDVTLTAYENQKTTCSSVRVTQHVRVNEAPVARAGRDVVRTCVNNDKGMTVNFDASASYDNDNDPLTYHWNFKDGEQGEGKKITHTYKKSGHYEPMLTVNDNSGLSCAYDTAQVSVKLSRSPRARAGHNIAACLSQPIVFDGKSSYVESGDALFSKWSFGDGETEGGLTAHHTYQRVGKYMATLKVQNAYDLTCPGSSDSIWVTVDTKPFVTLKAVEPKCVGDEIIFDASRSGDPDGQRLEYLWSFGDGTVQKSGPRVIHSYKKGGIYHVSVIVDDNQGSDCSSVSDNIVVKVNTPPEANAGKNTACCAGEFNLFDGSASYDADGNELLYEWTFGDGMKASKPVVTHAFEQRGVYKVILTVDDQSGTSCSRSSDSFMTRIQQSSRPVIRNW